jgi:hypothetical protein
MIKELLIAAICAVYVNQISADLVYCGGTLCFDGQINFIVYF